MKNSYKKIIVLFLIISLSFFTCYLFNIRKNNNIDLVLKTKDYSYLPEEAKDYIKEIVLTEKNKVQNKSYLNPLYVEYLSLSDEEKQKEPIIPMAYTIDYVNNSRNTQLRSNELPSSFDLRNVNGESYITPLKDQGEYGLCWAFASLEQIESLLMVKNHIPYNENTILFSQMQLHYSTSKDGIKNYDNSNNGYRSYNGDMGGNFGIASYAMINGITLVDESKIPYNTPIEQQELYETLNYSNSLYEVNATIDFPKSDNVLEEEKDEYLKEIKNAIISYGGASAGTISPHSDCGLKNKDDKYILDVQDDCNHGGGHLMQIIGWDDNYEYDYCSINSKHISVNNNGTCDDGALVSGKGAWLVRNSWGENTDADYIYLSYNSKGVNIGLATSISSMSEKNWDNNYHSKIVQDSFPKTSWVWNFKKNSNDPEKLEKIEKIKFKSVGYNGSFSLFLENEKIKDIETILPGIYEVPLTNVIIPEGYNFHLKLESNNNVEFDYSMFSVFTSNLDNEVEINTKDVLTTDNSIIVYSKTRNILSNEVIEYELFKDNNDYTNKIEVKNNIVAHNDINTNLILSDDLEKGIYFLKTKYDGKEFLSKIEIGNKIAFDSNGGSGTMNDVSLSLSNSIELPENSFEKEGYTFVGWNTKADGTGTSYEDEQEITLSEDMILYAQWMPISYKIVFNSNNGQENTEEQIFTYDELEKLRKNTFIKTGYMFKEWNTKVNGTGDSYKDEQGINNITSINNKTINLYAQWTPITYTVIFNSNDLVNTTSIQELTYDQSEKLNKNTFVKTNYSFKNWNTESDGSGNPYIDEEEVLNLSSTQNDIINLYAQWEINRINISFDSNTGIGTMDGYTTDSGITNNLPKNTFTKTGYTFKEWNTASDGTGTSYVDEQQVSLEDSATLYAQWTPITYTVIFNSNDLENVTSIQELTYDQSEKLNKNTFVKTNYSFINWNTKSDGSGNPYIDEEEVLNLSSTQDDVINLYAQWGNNVVYVDFNSNRGTGTMNRLTIDAGTTNTLPKNTFTKTRYTFKEWNTKSDGTGISYADEQEISLENSVTLYAQWEEKEYTVTLYKNDGTTEKSEINVGNLEEFEFYNAFSRMNYDFLYWEDIDTGDKYYNDDTFVITSNKEFNAIWDKVIFDIIFDPYGNGESVVNRSLSKNTPTYLFSVNNPDKEFLGWKDRNTNEFYEKDQSITPTDDMYLVGVWKDESSSGYKINNYLVDETNKYISKVMVGTTLNNYRSNFELSSGYTINVKLKNDVLYTGSITKIYNNNVLEDEYTNVVIGDINGDGIINSSDLLRVRQHLLGINVLEGYKFLSSDINYDNTINSSDLLRMRQHLIGSKSISE